jgi:hypothetical protein
MTEGSRVPGAADPATLRALATGRSTTRTLSDDLLTHLPDLGDLPTQRALDTWVEQAADTLRALSEALEERLLDLGAASHRPQEDADDADDGASLAPGPATRSGDSR